MVKKLSRSEIKSSINEYRKYLLQHNIRVDKIILYGSYAKGGANSYSDVDLIVISKDLARFKPLRRQEILSELTMYIDAPLEVLGYTPQEFSRSKETIFGEIIRRTGKSM